MFEWNVFLECADWDQEGVAPEGVAVPIDSLIVLYVIKYAPCHGGRINFIKRASYQKGRHFLLKPGDWHICSLLPAEVSSCALPSLFVPKDNLVVTGLCALARFLILSSSDQKHLLGYQGGCLSAPLEVSPWTRFCEVDLPTASVEIVQKHHDGAASRLVLPAELSKLEAHLGQPMRVTNIRRRMQRDAAAAEKCVAAAALSNQDPIAIFASTHHVFLEGPDLLLSDIIVYTSYLVIRQLLRPEVVCALLPRTAQWLRRMDASGADDVAGALLQSSVPSIDGKEKSAFAARNQRIENNQLLPTEKCIQSVNTEENEEHLPEGVMKNISRLSLKSEENDRVLNLETLEKGTNVMSDKPTKCDPTTREINGTYEKENVSLESVGPLQAALTTFESYTLTTVEARSLYRADGVTRGKPFTRQQQVTRVLTSLEEAMAEAVAADSSDQEVRLLRSLCQDEHDNEQETVSVIDWSALPPEVHPLAGNLPEERRLRKCQQLENMARVVIDIVKGHPCWETWRPTLVDFCSGGGHLGLLLATLLPAATVCLVENKAESLRRARERAAAMGLANLRFFQCNLDYFCGSFDVGVSLHACGSATDLVLAKCLSASASFVCCPCCYGAMAADANTVAYPRSNTFKRLNCLQEDYLVLGHTADQSGVAEGARAMRLVDADRALSAAERGYGVSTRTMRPPTCSPKNAIIVGVHPAHINNTDQV